MSVKVNGTRVPPGTDDQKWLRQLTSRNAERRGDTGYLPPLIVQKESKESRTQSRDVRQDQRDARPTDSRRDARRDSGGSTRADARDPRLRVERSSTQASSKGADRVENSVVPAAPAPTAPERPRSGKPVQARSVNVPKQPAAQQSSSSKQPQYFLVPDKTIGAERRVPLLNMNTNPLLSRRISMKQSVPAAVAAAVQYVRSSSRTTHSPPASPRSPVTSPRLAAQAGARAVATGVHRLAAQITGAAEKAGAMAERVLSPKGVPVPRPPGTDRPNGAPRAPSRRYENSQSGGAQQ